MPTLSIVRTDFGKLLKWGAVLIAVIIILFIVLKLLLFVKELVSPSAPPPPTVSFGKLPKTYFPEGIKKDFTYEVDTLTGDLPTFNLSEKVYKMELRGPDILAVDKVSEKVKLLGFNSRPEQISDFVYKWTNPSPPEQIIIINTKLSEFNLTSSYIKYEADFKDARFSDKSQPIDTANNFLQSLEFYPEDIDEEKTKVEFAYFNNGVINPTSRIVNSNVAIVYFFQKERDKLPIVYPQGTNSTMRMVVGAGDRNNLVLDGKFSHQNILDENSTYPIKTAQEAFDELKGGKGFISTYSGNGSNVKIKKIYPALYSEGKIQEYMIPVIVFEGTDNFVAYIPAVKDEWVNN